MSKNTKKQLRSYMLEEDLFTPLKIRAALEGKTQSKLISDTLRDYLKEKGAKDL